jgi:hypothetical protein
MIHRASQGAAIFRATRPAVLLALALTAPAAALDLALPEGATIVAATPPGPAHPRDRHRPLGRQPRASPSTVSGTVRAAAWQVPVESDPLHRRGRRRDRKPARGDQGYVIDLTCADRPAAGSISAGSRHGSKPRDACRHRQFPLPRRDRRTGGSGRRRHRVARRPDDLCPCRACRRPQRTRHGSPRRAARRWNIDARRRYTSEGDTPPPHAIARLAEFGAVPLDDLRFRTGASELSGTDYPSLVASPPFSPKTPPAASSSWAIPMPKAGATATSRSARRAPRPSAAT